MWRRWGRFAVIAECVICGDIYVPDAESCGLCRDCAVELQRRVWAKEHVVSGAPS